VILVDVNLLLVATIEEAGGHAEARSWLGARLSGSARVGLPWPVLIGFMRIAGQPRVWERPVPLGESVRVVRSWLSRPCAWTPEPGPSHLEIFERLVGDRGSVRQVADAHLAAIAIEHGLTVCSLDQDFARWERLGLRWEDPLAGRWEDPLAGATGS
jgi:toxin-antitoxin system PIN domain toxin